MPSWVPEELAVDHIMTPGFFKILARDPVKIVRLRDQMLVQRAEDPYCTGRLLTARIERIRFRAGAQRRVSSIFARSRKVSRNAVRAKQSKQLKLRFRNESKKIDERKRSGEAGGIPGRSMMSLLAVYTRHEVHPEPVGSGIRISGCPARIVIPSLTSEW